MFGQGCVGHTGNGRTINKADTTQVTEFRINDTALGATAGAVEV
ncbi:hypothetical protein [Antarctobacter jejuensis]